MVEITIGIPVYNSEKTLERALDSALGQTFLGRYEIIVLDDGSQDSSPNIARAYALQFPDKVRCFRFNNRGVATSRNAIIKRAKGRFLTWLDADDWYFPEKLQSQYDALEAALKLGQPDVMVMSNYQMDGNLVDLRPQFRDVLRNVLTGSLRSYLWATIVPLDTVKKVGNFNQSLHRGEDQDWLIRLLLLGFRLEHDGAKSPLCRYSFGSDRSGKHAEEGLKHLLDKYGDLYAREGLLDEYVPRRYWEISAFYRANRQWDDMWRCRGVAAQRDPERYFPRVITELTRDIESKFEQRINSILAEQGRV